MIGVTDWSSDAATPPDGKAWDLVVMGGGTAGIVAARTAAGFGASVVIVEQARPGGDCLWTGCVPSKALLASAHTAATARNAEAFGVQASEVKVDFASVMGRVHDTIAAIEPADAPETLRTSGAKVVHARARFTGPRSVALDIGEAVPFRHAVLATGSQPVVPPINGLDDAAPLTSDSVWDLQELPERLLILGGGSIGCELAQAFGRLGSNVTLIEAAERLLPREDATASAVLNRVLQADGIDVLLKTHVRSVRRAHGVVAVYTADGLTIEGDEILVAIGRQPRTEGLGLADAGIELAPSGHVAVDARLRTTNRRVWAAGDITGHPQFTHVAGVHGSLAASNAVLGLRRRVDTRTIPRVTYTHPEVAAFGVPASEGDLVLDLAHDEVDRSITDGEVSGITRLVLDRRRRIVGATIVGARAGELVGEVVVAARAKFTAGQLAATMHAYPTYSDAIWKPAIAEVREQLDQPAATWLTRRLAAWQRARHPAVRS